MTALRYPSAERNRGPILEALRPWLPEEALVLEAGCGSGQHGLFFAEALPGLRWLPCDLSEEAVASAAAWREQSGLPNLLPPQRLDASSEDWPLDEVDVIYSANVVHISPVAVMHGIVREAGRRLRPEGLLVLYGPYLVDGKPTTESNAAFDRSLQGRNPSWGLRDLDDLSERAVDAGLVREAVIEMPANNLLLIFRRTTA